MDQPLESPQSGAAESAAPAVPTARAPDRADAPVSETAERFLRGILQRLPLSRIEEVHLFSPLRQGSVETGIAVVAARPAPPVPLELPADTPAPAEAAGEAVPEAGGEAVSEAGREAVPGAGGEGGADAVPAAAPEAEAPVEAPVEAPAPAPAPMRRHEVYTARYRLVLKGPERGKWEADLVAEADAPLVTVETVVRGVQRRAGEATETVRYGAAQVARALRLPDAAP
jgi:hypothetical protein